MGTLVKGLQGQKEAWQRREVEASAWQEVSFALMKEVGRQLVWSMQAMGEPAPGPEVHQPYL